MPWHLSVLFSTESIPWKPVAFKGNDMDFGSNTQASPKATKASIPLGSEGGGDQTANMALQHRWGGRNVLTNNPVTLSGSLAASLPNYGLQVMAVVPSFDSDTSPTLACPGLQLSYPCVWRAALWCWEEGGPLVLWGWEQLGTHPLPPSWRNTHFATSVCVALISDVSEHLCPSPQRRGGWVALILGPQMGGPDFRSPMKSWGPLQVKWLPQSHSGSLGRGQTGTSLSSALSSRPAFLNPWVTRTYERVTNKL